MFAVNAGCRAVLLTIFVYQVIKSLNKLYHGELATFIFEEPVNSHKIPTIAICVVPTHRTLRRPHEWTMEEAYNEIGDHDTISGIGMGNTASIKDLDELARNYLEPKELLKDDSLLQVHRTYAPLEGELFTCQLVTVSKNISLSEMVRLEFVPSSLNWHTLIHFEDQVQFTSPGSELLGGTKIMGSSFSPQSASLIELEEKIIVSKSRPNRICNEEHLHTSMFQCILDFHVEAMPCHLPWVTHIEGPQKRSCNETEDWMAWTKLWNILYKDVTHNNIVKATGCVPSCRLRKYEAKVTSTKIPPLGDAISNKTHNLYIQMPQPMVTFQSEKYFYDSSSFIADVGGFLGLLLGLSVMDIAEIVINLVKRVMGIQPKIDLVV